MRRIALVVLTLFALPTVVSAQPEDRQRAPTGAASPDPCAEVAGDRARGPQPTWPAFDPRVPAPAGATSFTGIAPPAHDPSRNVSMPPGPTDVTYQDCRRRLGY